MFTKEKVLKMVEEFYVEKEKTEYVPVYYKRNGAMIRRSYDKPKYTKRYEELFYDEDKKFLRSKEAQIFECECCGKMVGYWDLEAWVCDFEEDEYTCSLCYEDEMGEDL